MWTLQGLSVDQYYYLYNYQWKECCFIEICNIEWQNHICHHFRRYENFVLYLYRVPSPTTHSPKGSWILWKGGRREADVVDDIKNPVFSRHNRVDAYVNMWIHSDGSHMHKIFTSSSQTINGKKKNGKVECNPTTSWGAFGI